MGWWLKGAILNPPKWLVLVAGFGFDVRSQTTFLRPQALIAKIPHPATNDCHTCLISKVPRPENRINIAVEDVVPRSPATRFFASNRFVLGLSLFLVFGRQEAVTMLSAA